MKSVKIQPHGEKTFAYYTDGSFHHYDTNETGSWAMYHEVMGNSVEVGYDTMEFKEAAFLSGQFSLHFEYSDSDTVKFTPLGVDCVVRVEVYNSGDCPVTSTWVKVTEPIEGNSRRSLVNNGLMMAIKRKVGDFPIKHVEVTSIKGRWKVG